MLSRLPAALKASPQFLEQKQRLERAKMGDFLKNKMQHRPDRDTLIRAHILEDTSAKLDPSLQDKQRRLKRARLKDDLNDRLAHRPGPLELIRGNILQADETFAQAIKGLRYLTFIVPTLMIITYKNLNTNY